MAYGISLQLIENLTLHVDVLAEHKLYPLEAVAYGAESILLLLPELKLGAGSLVSIKGELMLDDKRLPFVASGKMLSAVPDPHAAMLRVEIQLHQYDRPLWELFCKSKQLAQNHANQLLSAMTGYDP